ncbi:MAG TPA: ABC transporter substrate-binding protein [Egicoccus sp.]|nr:ABC transporter substrate-binding protein [Egicoccus sp.]HSK24603.1 ABC transporter substrate-binding protein [Egicoccus sp.]
MLAAVALVATGCGDDNDNGAADADAEEPAGAAGGEPEEIIVLLPNPSAVNVFNLCAAIGEGYLEEEGIAVDIEAVDGSGAVIQAMVAGQAQIGLPGPGPVLNARAAGEELRMFYNSFSQSLFGLVTAADSDIASIEDLSGATIGVGTAEGSEVSYARSILSDAGLEEGTDYEFLAVGDGGPATAAFERGEIDAYSAAISDMAIIEARGLALKEITPEKFLAFFGNGFAATAEYMDENPEIIQGFTTALLRGNEWALDNKEGTLEHCAEMNPEEGRDAELASALYDAVVPRSQPLGDDPVGAYPLEGWQAWEASLLEAGELDEPVDDLGAVFTNEFVEAGS